MQDLQTWTKITPILALVGVLVLLSSQGQFFLLYTANTKGKIESGKNKKFLFAFISNFDIFAHGLPITTSVEVLWSLMLINGSPFTSVTCGLVNPLEAIQKYYLPFWKNEYLPPWNEYFWNTIKFVGSCINLCIFIFDFSYPLQLPIYVHGAIAFNIYILSWRS